MPKSWSSREIEAALLAAGFAVAARSGSHVKYRHPDGRIVVLQAGRKDVPPGTLASIRRMSGLKLR